jgi:hypothetical protein
MCCDVFFRQCDRYVQHWDHCEHLTRPPWFTHNVRCMKLRKSWNLKLCIPCAWCEMFYGWVKDVWNESSIPWFLISFLEDLLYKSSKVNVAMPWKRSRLNDHMQGYRTGWNYLWWLYQETAKITKTLSTPLFRWCVRGAFTWHRIVCYTHDTATANAKERLGHSWDAWGPMPVILHLVWVRMSYMAANEKRISTGPLHITLPLPRKLLRLLTSAYKVVRLWWRFQQKTPPYSALVRA